MSIGDSMTLVSCLAGLILALPGLMTFLHLMFNRTTQRAALRLSIGAKSAFFAGLVPLIVLGWLSIAIMSVGGVFQLGGDIMLLLLLGWILTGMSVVARLIGVKLSQIANRDENPLAETVVGAFVLTFAIAFPLVGWFLVLPFTWIIGSGGMVLVLLNRQNIAPALPHFAPEQVAGD